MKFVNNPYDLFSALRLLVVLPDISMQECSLSTGGIIETLSILGEYAARPSPHHRRRKPLRGQNVSSGYK